MVQRGNNNNNSSRLLFLHQVTATSVVVILLSLSCCCIVTTAWVAPPVAPLTITSTNNNKNNPLFSSSSSSSSSVDELYYTPTTLPGSGTANSILFDDSSSTLTTSTTAATTTTTYSSEEMEIAARNYGAGTTASNSSSSSSGSSQQKITLTRWLSAKVQDYPELRDMESLHLSIQMACKTISNLIHSSTTAKLSTTARTTTTTTSSTSSSSSSTSTTTINNNNNNSLRDNSMKRLDQISKNVLQNALRFTGRLRVVEAPRTTTTTSSGGEGEEEEGPALHQPGVTIAYALDSYGKDGSSGGSGMMMQGRKSRKSSNASAAAAGGARKNRSSTTISSSSSGALKEKRLAAYADAKWGKTRRLAAFFDPLDGSGNADAAIPTGTVFGVFDADAAFPRGEIPDMKDTASLARAVLQPGNSLLAAGYCMYSSTTILVFTLGGGTHGFTLDPTINEFVLTHPNMKIPKRGNIYSCNEAYSEGWDDNLKQYLKTIKTGKGESGQRYTQRYIGSMVGDVHRTLMYGGIFCCPSDTEVHHNGNLQLLYKSAPMAYILEHAGGKSTNGVNNLLSVKPERVHQRSPCFMGSPEDMDELMKYMSGEKGASQ